MDEIFENIKQEADKKLLHKMQTSVCLHHQFFFQSKLKQHYSTKLLMHKLSQIVHVIDKASLILELNKPRKKLCPKLEKNVKINPKTITFKLKLLNIKNYEL